MRARRFHRTGRPRCPPTKRTPRGHSPRTCRVRRGGTPTGPPRGAPRGAPGTPRRWRPCPRSTGTFRKFGAALSLSPPSRMCFASALMMLGAGNVAQVVFCVQYMIVLWRFPLSLPIRVVRLHSCTSRLPPCPFLPECVLRFVSAFRNVCEHQP